MLLISHIIIALFSLVYTLYLFFYPSKPGLITSYVLVALTVISGTALVIIKPAHMTQTCVTGLVYLAVIFSGIIAVHHKLAKI